MSDDKTWSFQHVEKPKSSLRVKKKYMTKSPLFFNFVRRLNFKNNKIFEKWKKIKYKDQISKLCWSLL